MRLTTMVINKKIIVLAIGLFMILGLYQFHNYQIGLSNTEFQGQHTHIKTSSKGKVKVSTQDGKGKGVKEVELDTLEASQRHLNVFPVPNSMTIPNSTTNQGSQVPATPQDKDLSELFDKNLYWVRGVAHPQYDMSTIQQEQVERMSLVEKVCRERKSLLPRNFAGHVFYRSFNGVAWCLMPKTGSTNILRMICLVVGPKCTSLKGYPDEYHYVPRFMGMVNDLSPYTPERGNWKTRSFLYVFVRDPWQRLVSTYIEKVLFTDSYIIICSFGKNKLFIDLHQEQRKRKETLSFKQFLQYCVIAQHEHGGPVKMEPHLKPQSISGSFCDLSYSFIGKTETYNEDIKVVLQQYKVPDVSELMLNARKYRKPNEKSNLTSTSYLDHWKTIDTEMITKVRNIYSNDLAMFDYANDPY